MSLILFLIVAGFLFLTISSDKAAGSLAKSSFEKERAEKERDYELWMATVRDKDLEIELQDFIYDNTRAKSGKKFAPDTDPVTWMSPELKERLSDIPPDVVSFCSTRDELLLVLLAKKGKIPMYFAQGGIRCVGDNCTTPGRRRFQHQRRFIMWLDEELQKHGVEPMRFKKDSNPLQRTDFAKDVTKSCSGTYCWWSGRCYVI